MATTEANDKRIGKFDKLIGPTDPAQDSRAIETIVTARIGLIFRHPFFGKLATGLKLVNGDEWLATAATDGVRLYYNSRFINMLKPKEVQFLLGHEILHLVYDHLGRNGHRDHKIYNIAADFVVNAELKNSRIGEMITTVGCLYDPKYDGMTSEEVYDDLMKNAKKMKMEELLDKMFDQHLEPSEGDGAETAGDTPGKTGPVYMSDDAKERAKREFQQSIINAARSSEAGSLPAGVKRIIDQLTSPVMPWRDLIQSNLTSILTHDTSYIRPSRKGQHLDAIMPGRLPGEEIEVDIYLDLSGSISHAQGRDFISEVAGMMEMFEQYSLRVTCFDTQCYNTQEYTTDNFEDIAEYELMGGGGTMFTCIFDDLKEANRVPKMLVVFTDGYPAESHWGDPTGQYCPGTLFVIHGSGPDCPHSWGISARYDRAEEAANKRH